MRRVRRKREIVVIQSQCNTRTLGRVGVGPVVFAVPADSLVEAVDAPPAYLRLPRAPGHLLGLFRLRDETVAVLDTHALLALPAPAEPSPHVLIVAHEGKRFGLAVDSVGSVDCIAQPETAELEPGEHAPAQLFPRVFYDAQTDALVGVLDVAALMRQPGVASVAGRGAPPSAAAASATCRTRASMAVVRCGRTLLALSADAIRSVSVMPALERPLPGSASFLGMLKWRDADLPVMTFSGLSGLPDARTGENGYLMVAELDGACIGFPVDELVDLGAGASVEIMPLPAGAFAHPGLFAGSMQLAGRGLALVIDARALFALPAVAAFVARPAGTPPSIAGARRSGPGRDPAEAPAAGASHAGGFVVFGAGGGTFACRLGHVIEILPCPAETLHTRTDGPGIGLVCWRGRLIELIDMAAVIGRPAGVAGGRCILVVQNDAGVTRGIVIDAMHSLSGSGEPAELASMYSAEDGRQKTLVILGAGQSRRTYELVDLRTLAD
jgi:chemotaxis signal transduction protein